MADLGSYRQEFPVLSKRTYLISASLGPLSRRSRALAEQHLDLWARLGPEELWMDHGLPMLQRCRSSFAALIGADADEIAIVPSVSNGLSSLVSCFDFFGRNTVVGSDMDFPTNHYVYRANESRGLKLDVAPSRDGIAIQEQDLIERIDENTLLVNVNRSLFESSWLMDVAPIARAAHDAGAYVLVDDFHGSGIVPIDVHELGIDFLLSGALKWLLGGQGLAFLYCRRDLIVGLEPRVAGWFGTKDPFDFDRSSVRFRDDARRFETGTYAMPQAFTAVGGLEIIAEVGVDRIREHNQRLTRLILQRCDDAGIEVASPRDDNRRGGLVRLRLPGGPAHAQQVLQQLFEQDVVVDQRGDALRVSPHFFNHEGDIERFFEVLAAVL